MKPHFPVEIHYSAEDEGFIATYPDLPGCSAWGATEAEVLSESHAAAAAWLKACKAAGNPIPTPSGRCAGSALRQYQLRTRRPFTMMGFPEAWE